MLPELAAAATHPQVILQGTIGVLQVLSSAPQVSLVYNNHSVLSEGSHRQHQFALHALVIPPEALDLLLRMLAVPVDTPVVVVQRCDLLLCCLTPPNQTMNGGVLLALP